MNGGMSLQEFLDIAEHLNLEMKDTQKEYQDAEGSYAVTLASINSKSVFFTPKQKILLYCYKSNSKAELGYIKLDKDIVLEVCSGIQQNFEHYVIKYLRTSSTHILLDQIKDVYKPFWWFWPKLILYFNDTDKITFSFQNYENLNFWEAFIQEYRTQKDIYLQHQTPMLIEDIGQIQRPLIAAPSKAQARPPNIITSLRVQNANLKQEIKTLEKQLQKFKGQFQKTIHQHKIYATKLQTYNDELKQKVAGLEQRQRPEDCLLISTLQKHLEEERAIVSKLRQENNVILERLQRLEELQQENRNLRLKDIELGQLKEEVAHNQAIAREKLAKLKIQKFPYESITPHLKVDIGTDPIQQQNESQSSLLLELMQERYLHIFQGNVLHTCLHEKQFLQQEIEKYTGMHIKMTKLLYKYDQLNKTNFHKYIDGHPNICLVLKLANGRLIAGYTQSPVIEGVPATEGALILSLTERKSFPLQQGKRAVTFDSYFLIFGNSELRIKNADMAFFTNFGIGNCYYNSKGQSYNVLTGDGTKREEIMEGYEIFEVVFG